MFAPIRLPDLKVSSVVLSVWYAQPGDEVFEGDRLVEVLVGSATFDVPAPATGKLVEQKVWAGDSLVAGQVLGTIEMTK
ncbi:MAG: biotin/lipoyl-containing protein [Gemmataceae bacterium]